MPAPQIRTLAICLFSESGRILVNEGIDPANGQRFWRPLGGGIEFGETGAQAIAREIREEIGAGVSGVRYLGTLENFFTYLGQARHEIVLVYDGALADRSMDADGVVRGAESDGQSIQARWRSLDSFGPAEPLVPAGLLDLISQRTRERRAR